MYFAEGLAGPPSFTDGSTAWTLTRLGVPTIIGPTAGDLFAFPVAAFAVGWLAEHGWDRRPLTAALAMIAGEVIIYAIGLPWLAFYVGIAQAVPLGMVPFLTGDALKLTLATAALPSGWRLLSAFGSPTPRH